jgi:hypothetical protein
MGSYALALPLFLGWLRARNDAFKVRIDALVLKGLAGSFFGVTTRFLMGLLFAPFLLSALPRAFLLRHLVVSRHGAILPDLALKHF